MKTIKVYNEENVNVNVEFDKVTSVGYYGTDADFNVIVTDKEGWHETRDYYVSL